MDPFERKAFIENELAAFKEGLLCCSSAPLTVRLATERIHEKLFDPELTIARLRRHLGLSGAAFSTRFRRYHGRTPKRYTRHLRVKAAKRLLRHDELPVMDIAFEVGYEHYRTFARIFKRHAECSPSAFREERPE